MPAAQRDLLLWLLEFLAACADHAASSKMGVEQLAVCFAPLVVHSVEKAPQAEQLLAAKRAVDVTRALLEWTLALRPSTAIPNEPAAAAAVAPPPRIAKRSSAEALAEGPALVARPVRQRSGGSGGSSGLTTYMAEATLAFDA
mmetsp:Transcript_19805/g.53444  ORF Transcript_19805/g.53444 Transcript_19805/m.53444 type:complete len:143 (+) Transcript_19805:224-652(+)